MTSVTTARFRTAFKELPADIQRRARAAYRRFVENPQHPGLRFRQVHASEPIYSARVSRDYRALAILDGETVVWFWIGSHSDDDELLGHL